MEHKTNVVDIKVLKAEVKTNIVDEGLDVFYDPMFYDKQQAYDILQQLKTEIVDDSPDCSSFTTEGLTLSSSGHQVEFEDERMINRVCKKGPWSSILTKIRNDIVKKLGISLDLCLVDWDKDGRDKKELTMEDIDTSSPII